MLSNQAEQVRYAVSADAVAVDVQVPQRAAARGLVVTAQCGGDAFQTLVVESGATQHQRRHVVAAAQRRHRLVHLQTNQPLSRISFQSINLSINQSKHICIAPYVANESTGA